MDNTSPVKVLLFTGSFPPPLVGGSVEYVYNIASNLPENSVIIHTANADPVAAKEIDKNFPQRIIRSSFISQVLGTRRKTSFFRRKTLSMFEYFLWPVVALRLIRREKPDIVHIGEHNFAGVAALLAKRFWKIPYMYYTYAEEITILSQRKLHNKIFGKILRSSDMVLAVSHYTRDLLLDFGVSQEQISIVLPAVSDRKMTDVSKETVESIRQKYNLSNSKIILTVGALEERKGHTSVISALPYIDKAFPDIKYVIVGVGSTKENLLLQLKETKFAGQVIFAGRVDDTELNCIYEICDIFVMAHRQILDTLDTEGCPTVFLEASSHGKPVVGGNAGGVADAILDERTGFIIDGTDEIELSNTIIKLLDNPELAAEMGEAGRKYSATLTPKLNAQKVLQISRDVINQNQNRNK